MEKFLDRSKKAVSGARAKLTLAAIVLSIVSLACLNHAASQAAAGADTAANGGIAVATSYADVVSRVAPSVVTVRSERVGRAPQQHPFMDDPFFRDFFGDRAPQMQQQPRERRQRGLGSGVVVSADGYILTNHHVIDGAEQIKVELKDNRVLDAKLVGSDKLSDLAVLKIDATGLPVLPLGNSDNVRVGDVALAVGNPLGVGQTVTMGIISAKGRVTGLSDGSFEDFLQTDAPINQGNSGGALVNTNGELVGINSQILSPSGGSIGIGFAIPSNMAKGVMEQLIRTGKVRRGQLGIVVQPVTADIAASIGLQDARGLIVSFVSAGSAAERSGLKRGDVITALNGAPVGDSNSFRNQVAATAPQTDVSLTILRDGREQQVRASLGELKADADNAAPEEGANRDASNGGKLGIRVEPLTAEMAARLKLQSGAQGLVVADVDPTGPASEAGLLQNDVIEEVNRQPVRAVADLTSAISRANDRPLLLLVNRGGTSIFVTVRPRK
ncbi:MAG TPA: DegQ family serine endoprotease [Pyrinomonadaceae bacterium]|jgi:Do/DeqQ family serine protease|nr:DegQ family serine endoprotease [Pyrinomonadaceae bacterium]